MAVAPAEDPESDEGQESDVLDDGLHDADQDSLSEEEQTAQVDLTPGIGAQILQTLQSVDSRLQGLEARVTSNALAIKKISSGGTRPKVRPAQQLPVSDVILPSASALNKAEIQAQVDERLRDVTQMQGSGRYKSHRGGLKRFG